LLISGTASIEPGGRSAHPGDPRKQIQLTMEVVAAILESCRMSFADVTRSTVYFKQLADARLFEQWCQTNDLDIPGVWVEADICRDELLFEIELDAMTTGHSALSPKPAQDRPSSHRD
jgi:enamine deaminase RidA (YjgF/YER057c/UK114 family)